MANPNPNRGEGSPFPNPDRRRRDPSFNEYRMKIEIPSFSRNLDIESFLDWVYEVEKYLGKACQVRDIQAQMRSGHMVRPAANHNETPRQVTSDDMEVHKAAPISPSIRLSTDPLQSI